VDENILFSKIFEKILNFSSVIYFVHKCALYKRVLWKTSTSEKVMDIGTRDRNWNGTSAINECSILQVRHIWWSTYLLDL